VNHSGKLHALLATARVANVPSVISNVWLGVAMGVSFWWVHQDQSGFLIVTISHAYFLMISGVCLYVFGNFLNDWKDRKWDEVHRPERALPSGLFKPGTYLVAACALAIVGFGLAISVSIAAGLVALAIIACVVIYTVWHKEKAWSVVFMGLCRGLLPLLGASLVPPSMWLAGVCGAALCCYIAGLSLSARAEARGEIGMGTRWVSRGLWVLAGMLMLWPHLWFSQSSWLLWAAALVYAGWLGLCLTCFRVPVSRHVSALLAGIPLLDWIFLLPLLTMLGSAEIASAVIPPLAFVSALLLQRLAPAT
jgi:4-hydroxybenzoate polyprenyltransferase